MSLTPCSPVMGDVGYKFMNDINFYRVNDKFGCFSNFSAHPIFLDGTTWPTSEHYFQAQKFKDYEIQRKIQSASSPMIAAELGRNRNFELRHDWEDIKNDIMRKAVNAKVMQHSDVRETLLSTGTAIIYEHTKNDNYWADGGDKSGQNMLGIILMEIRDGLTSNGPYNELSDLLPPPWIQYPEIERYSIGWRMGYGEGFLMEWWPFYGGLSNRGKKRYQELYPEPDEWNGFYKEQEE